MLNLKLTGCTSSVQMQALVNIVGACSKEYPPEEKPSVLQPYLCFQDGISSVPV